MRVLGMISGTSHDGIDVAVVDFAECDDTVTARIEYAHSTPYPQALRERLVAVMPPAPADGAFDLGTVCELDTGIGREFARAAAEAISVHRAAGFGPVELICSHGQTVFHWVDGGSARGTLQLGQPAWIAEATGLPVVSDMRAADIAAGGQGAPLVPILDRALLRPLASDGLRAAALNLGGIANLTVVSGSEAAAGRAPRPATAWDIGPANALIDAVVTASPETPHTFDRDGALAAAGTVDERLLERLLAEPYYALPAPKSTGKELFHLGYVRKRMAAAGTDPSLADLVATLTELTARTVADAVGSAGVDIVVTSGGGARNPVMMRRISALMPGVEMRTSDAFGVPSDAKEAVAFAVIGWATAHGLPGNVPSCTGAAGERVLGRVSPGPDGALPARDDFERTPDIVFRAVADTPRTGGGAA